MGADRVEEVGEGGGRQFTGRPGQGEGRVLARNHLGGREQSHGGPALLGEFGVVRVAEFILVGADDVVDHVGVVADGLFGTAAVGVRAFAVRGQQVEPPAHGGEAPFALPGALRRVVAARTREPPELPCRPVRFGPLLAQDVVGHG